MHLLIREFIADFCDALSLVPFHAYTVVPTFRWHSFAFLVPPIPRRMVLSPSARDLPSDGSSPLASLERLAAEDLLFFRCITSRFFLRPAPQGAFLSARGRTFSHSTRPLWKLSPPDTMAHFAPRRVEMHAAPR